MKRFFKTVGVLVTVVQVAVCFPVLGQLAPAPAAAVTAKTDGPRIKFSETLFDFGKVKSSDVLRHDFIVTNTGNALLEITDVKPGCGCTTAGAWDRQIQPGHIGKIPIQFSPANFSGTVTKPVMVTCNDPLQGNYTLQIQANIWRPVDVQPSYVYFMTVEGEATNDTKTVRIINHLDEPLTLDAPQCANPAFKTELKTVQPGKEFELRVTYTGSVSNVNPQGYVTIKASSTNAPMIGVSVYAMAQPALVAMPPQIMLPAGQLSAGHRHSQTIRNNSSTPVKLTQAAVNAEGVTVQITEPQPGKLFLLTLNFPPNFEVRPGQPLELMVKTSHPKYSVIGVPIVQAPSPTPLVVRPPSSVSTGSK